jgi:DNA-binding HxlR family transcriptional regulator
MKSVLAIRWATCHARLVKSYGQYCPVARAAEIFAERWTPIILRNISLECHSFNQILGGAPGLSKTLLSDRLRSLERAGVVETVPNPHGRGSLYYLTDAGHELAEVAKVLGRWGARWTDLEVWHLDPYVVLWGKCRLWDLSKLPRPRIVIRFDISDFRQPLWILVQAGGAEVCAKHPGFDEDLVITTDRETLALWHSGTLSYRDARAAGALRIEGERSLVRTFPEWVPLSMFAGVKPARSA